MAASAALQQNTTALFNGYPNSSRTAVKEFLDYVFGLAPDPDPTFDTLTVTGLSQLQGITVLGNNVTISNAASAFTVHGISTFKKAVTIEKTLSVGELATFADDVHVAGALEVTEASTFFGTLLVTGPLSADSILNVGAAINADAEIIAQAEITAGEGITSGTVLQLGADADMNIAVTSVGGGKELYLVNQNTGGQVIIGGGDGDGTGQTQIGMSGDKIGFFNEATAAVQQTLPAAAPADATAMIAEWQTFKTKIAAYNFFALT